jgi:ABC-type multidrug transport system fused ATPase/permease subunit
MTVILKVAGYLRKHPLISFGALVSILGMSLFEGASFGMLIPLVQGMISGDGKVSFLSRIPLIDVTRMTHGQVISFIFIAFFAVIAVKNIFMYMSNILVAALRYRTIRDLNAELMGNLLTYDTAFFDRSRSGLIINTLTTETNRIGIVVKESLNFTAISAKVAAYLCILFLISWKVSLLMCAFIFAVVLPLETIMKRIKKTGRGISEVTADFNYKLTEILHGIRLIISRGPGY